MFSNSIVRRSPFILASSAVLAWSVYAGFLTHRAPAGSSDRLITSSTTEDARSSDRTTPWDNTQTNDYVPAATDQFSRTAYMFLSSRLAREDADSPKTVCLADGTQHAITEISNRPNPVNEDSIPVGQPIARGQIVRVQDRNRVESFAAVQRQEDEAKLTSVQRTNIEGCYKRFLSTHSLKNTQ